MTETTLARPLEVSTEPAGNQAHSDAVSLSQQVSDLQKDQSTTASKTTTAAGSVAGAAEDQGQRTRDFGPELKALPAVSSM
jgi:hypothetical protein